MTQATEISGVRETLGEVRGQLRELIHNVNSLSTKVDALNNQVVSAQETPAKFAELTLRVAQLETERNRRDGAAGVIATILKSPAIGWVVGAGATGWAILTDRIHG
jgi:chromosome segregation ATPase